MTTFYLKKTLYQTLILITLLCWLTACTSMMPNRQTPTWPATEHRLQQLHTWQAKGVVSATTAQGRQTAYVTWQQSPKQFVLTFSSAIGGGARLQGTRSHVQLNTADGKIYHGHDPNALAKQLLGWSLPVNGLQYWIRGLPAPGKHRLRLSDHQQIATLVQQGWHIRYIRYQQIGQYNLPYEMTLTRAHLQLHVIVKEWMLG